MRLLALPAADSVELRTTVFAPLKAVVSDGLAYDPNGEAAEQRTGRRSRRGGNGSTCALRPPTARRRRRRNNIVNS